MRRWALAVPGSLGASLLFLLTAGCDPTARPLAPVHGKVYYRGSSVRCGTIVFIPDAAHGSSGPLVRSEIQPDGGYLLRTGGAPGAVAGWYRVTVVATAGPPPAGHGQSFQAPRSLLPDKYRDPELSGLVREIKADRMNCIDFDLD